MNAAAPMPTGKPCGRLCADSLLNHGRLRALGEQCAWLRDLSEEARDEVRRHVGPELAASKAAERTLSNVLAEQTWKDMLEALAEIDAVEWIARMQKKAARNCGNRLQ